MALSNAEVIPLNNKTTEASIGTGQPDEENEMLRLINYVIKLLNDNKRLSEENKAQGENIWSLVKQIQKKQEEDNDDFATIPIEKEPEIPADKHALTLSRLNYSIKADESTDIAFEVEE